MGQRQRFTKVHKLEAARLLKRDVAPRCALRSGALNTAAIHVEWLSNERLKDVRIWTRQND